MHRYFKKIGNTAYIFSWESKAFFDKINKSPSAHNNFLDPLLNYLGAKTRVKFDGSCLKQDKITNIYVVYETNKHPPISSFPTLQKFFVWCSYSD